MVVTLDSCESFSSYPSLQCKVAEAKVTICYPTGILDINKDFLCLLYRCSWYVR